MLSPMMTLPIFLFNFFGIMFITEIDERVNKIYTFSQYSIVIYIVI